MSGFWLNFLGSRNDRLLNKYNKIISKINDFEVSISALSDNELSEKTPYFIKLLSEGKNLDDILPEAFAVVRETSRRLWDKRIYDVQMIGGIILHNGKISEMKTGEGKTLTATLPAYLNALSGKTVHIVTVNEYLAERDAQKMGELFSFLGLTTSFNSSGSSGEQKKEIYNANIIYGTNSEFGFDYLRDNMVFNFKDKVQTGLHYAIVDEVDSILIDEARTPLIISGLSKELTELYSVINTIPPQLVKGSGSPEDKDYKESGDYSLDLKSNKVFITEEGHEKIEKIMTGMGLIPEGSSLYDSSNVSLVHHINAAMKAHTLFHLDQHYVIRNNEVLIVDEFTGRIMEGRRWNDGLHQAIEAKENVKIQDENVNLATITLQNFFRLYDKLSGMTGTADTEAFEFQDIYKLETVVVPTNRPVQRQDYLDEVYLTMDVKNKAILADIEYCYKRGQPVLIGTSSIENNEFYSKLLTAHNFPHQMLNAKQHEKEAYVVSQAGKIGMITLATNMAGRGTDIILGGNIDPEIKSINENSDLSETEKVNKISLLKEDWKKEHDKVIELGGLHIIGTERNESRRIDNQFRGRAGRQGDPGSSRFYLSLEDPLLTIFSGNKVADVLRRLHMNPEEAITHPFMSKSLERAQKKIESQNFNIRKQLLDYDNVSNEQRNVIYARRNEILSQEDVSSYIKHSMESVIWNLVTHYIPEQSHPDVWDIPGLTLSLKEDFAIESDIEKYAEDTNKTAHDIFEYVLANILSIYNKKCEHLEEANLRIIEKQELLDSLDLCWRENLSSLEYLRQGIHLRSYAQKDPKQEYKREAFKNFENFIVSMKFEVTKRLLNIDRIIQDIANNQVAVFEEISTPNDRIQMKNTDAIKDINSIEKKHK